MSTSRQLEKVRQVLQWMIIAGFFGLLWLPTLDSFFHLDKTPMPNENRAPAEFPVFNHTLDGIRSFVAGLERYYNDHFGFRKRLIHTNMHWKHELFRESDLTDVLIGRDGWLYYAGDKMMENHLGLTQFLPQELRDWQSLLESRRDWLAKRGIAYIFVIAPDKGSVYPEYLPQWLSKPSGPTKLDQFVAYMKTNSSVDVLDLRPVLLEVKKTRQVYLTTDTHWNQEGAFFAHQELMRNLSRQLPGLEPLSKTWFKRTLIPSRVGGDLAAMLGQEGTMLERDDHLFEPIPPLQPLETVKAVDLLPGKKWIKYADPYYTVNTNRTGKAIIFRDSFAGFWLPFLGQDFGKVIYLWEYNWEPAFIEKEKPAVVIDEMLERFLYKTSPVELKGSDNLK